MNWKIRSAEPHWVTLEAWCGDDSPLPMFHMDVRWDGCAHIHRHWPAETSSDGKATEDYIHVCDIGEFARLMQEAVQIGLKAMPGLAENIEQPPRTNNGERSD